MSVCPGKLVRLKLAPNCTYTVVRLYTAYSEAPGWEEEWAELRSPTGKAAFWKVCQLERF